MRQYECECLVCGEKRQRIFCVEPYPELDTIFSCFCTNCKKETEHKRVLTRKAIAELKRQQQEELLQTSIVEKCLLYGFKCRFLYQSVVISTSLADWCFDYHTNRITLYHESTIKVNFETGDYAKAHVQFKDKKMTPLEVIEYIARHEEWKRRQMV